MLDALMELREMIEAAGMERVIFGSYAPMFYSEAAMLNMRESDLNEAERQAICSDNASRLLG
jgi:predicted TIM-barrel fold metal-dependent hydrolase